MTKNWRTCPQAETIAELIIINSEKTRMTKTVTLHQKCSFPLMISSVNVTKSAVSCGFGHIH